MTTRESYLMTMQPDQAPPQFPSTPARHYCIPMKTRPYLISLCLSLLIALAGIYISCRGFWDSWGTLVYLGKFDKLPDDFDTAVKTALAHSDHRFALLLIGFTVILGLNSCLLYHHCQRKK